MKKLLCCIIPAICLCSLICVLPLFSVTLRVPSQYPTIQQGLNAAQTGDTVLVDTGIYAENITWPSRDGIVLISEDGPQTTTIDGGGLNRVISFPNLAFTRNTEINGFAIQNGSADYGAGLYLHGSPQIVGNIIQRNLSRDTTTRHHGGGMYCDDNASPLIEANLIRGNVVDGPNWNYGGGIYVDDQNSAVIIGNIIEDDSAIGGYWNYGAGIYCRGTQPDVRHNIVRSNVNYQGDRGHGAGIYVGRNCNAYVLSNLIYNNVNRSGSWNYGAGMLVNSGAMAINNTIVSNSCIGGIWAYGGGIYIYDSTNTIGNNIVVNNTASQGGGIYCFTNGHATLLNNDVWNNNGGNYQGITPGANDISQDPLFITGHLGDYYLSQTAAGQGQDSPCLDYGFATAESLELDSFTTRTDSVYDELIVDLGYHYPVMPYVYIEESSEHDVTSAPRILFQISPTFSFSSYKIQLTLPSTSDVEVLVFDGLGRLQKTLYKGILPNGKNEWMWYGCNNKGDMLSSGVYFFMAKVESSEILSKKVILLR